MECNGVSSAPNVDIISNEYECKTENFEWMKMVNFFRYVKSDGTFSLHKYISS